MSPEIDIDVLVGTGTINVEAELSPAGPPGPVGPPGPQGLPGPVMNSLTLARISQAASLDLTVGGWTRVPFDTSTLDPGNHSSEGRYVASFPGYYAVSTQARVIASASGTELAICIYKNGNPLTEGEIRKTTSSDELVGLLGVDLSVQLDIGDYVESWVFTSGTAVLAAESVLP
jgi:hypothetical protein